MPNKVPCPKCGQPYAWNASKKRVRNHGTCNFDEPVQKKQPFRVMIAAPPTTNVYVPSDLSLQNEQKKRAEEEEYRINRLQNEQWMCEAMKKHAQELKEKETLDKIEAQRKEARDKEEAALQRQIAEQKIRFHRPQQTAIKEQQSRDIPVYWVDDHGGFYKVNGQDPYCRPAPLPAQARLFAQHRRRKNVWCKVFWNSTFGDTTDLCEGEWEMQWVYCTE